MAIFGKKKDKDQSGSGSGGNPMASPTQSEAAASSGTAATSSGPGQQQGNTIGKNSMTGGGIVNGGGVGGPGSQFGSPQSMGSVSGPAGTGAGGASGFKFGGIPNGPQGVNGGPVPPGSSAASMNGGGSVSSRTRKLSDESIGNGYQMPSIGSQAAAAGVGAGGMPPSSAAGMPFQGNPSGVGAPGSNNGAPPGSIGGQAGSSLNTAGGSQSSRPSQVVYPWSQRQLTVNAPRFLDANRQAPPGTLSPSPFPRYGLAANSTASPAGEVYLFGGLVRESVKNDLYTVHVDRVTQPPAVAATGGQPGSSPVQGGVSATLVQTTGDIPPPRVGHATVLVSNVLILWGGDTKVRADDKQDEGLYLLNLSTREWTRVVPTIERPNSCPMGRYGHTVSIVGSKFYVFGGQVDGLFLNDLWSFDLNSLKGNPTWDLVKPTGDLPPQRTGHASVTFNDKVYIFGGTDGQYHYNDTWCYDVTTNAWSELSCIGYIPVPREGHATCLVDDVMYIFGGRGVDGKDLGDLASFKITSKFRYCCTAA